MTTKHECLNECIWKDVSSMQTLFVLCGGQGRELQSVCLSVCGSVRFLAAFGSSAKLCPEHSYAPAKGTSFENGGTKRVKIRLRLSSLSSLNLWFCELVGKDQRWSKMIKESKCPKTRDSFYKFKKEASAWPGADWHEALHQLSSLVMPCRFYKRIPNSWNGPSDKGDCRGNAFADGTRGSQQSKARMLNLVEIAMMDWH